MLCIGVIHFTGANMVDTIITRKFTIRLRSNAEVVLALNKVRVRMLDVKHIIHELAITATLPRSMSEEDAFAVSDTLVGVLSAEIYSKKEYKSKKE